MQACSNRILSARCGAVVARVLAEASSTAISAFVSAADTAVAAI